MATNCPKCQQKNPDTAKFCSDCATPLQPSKDIGVTKTIETTVEELSRGALLADRYEIIEELGKGGMGKVYRALDTEVKEEVAVKLIKPEIAQEETTIERFRNELKVARKVSHRNICRMHDLGKAEEGYFITMEYVEGEDLKSLIRKKGKLSIDEVIGVAQQVCEGLAEAHELGVIHRDMKPQNIMIDDKGKAKIMDFGIARSVEAPGVTATGVIIGTPDYISPEQAEGQEADHRSDIYSLGVILYEMLTGSVPFKGDTAFSVALKHKTQLPQDPRKLNSQLSDDLSRLILVCMEKDRERRYQTAADLLADLQNIEEGFPLGTKIRPRRETFAQMLIRKKLFIPAMAVALAIVAITIWQLLPQKGVAYPPKIDNSIAVISFENQTGSKDYDIYSRTIPSLLITNLENTGYFLIVPWERLFDLLGEMGKKDVETIDSDLGFNLCRREGVKWIVTGSFSRAGDLFMTNVSVLDTESRALLKSASSQGRSVESIFLSQVDELSRKIAAGVGLSAQAVDSASWKMADITTPSPEAYNYFVRGKDEHDRYNWQDARRFLEKAVEIDPDFASAYRVLSEVNRRLGNTGAQNEYLKKALALSSKTNEKERLYILAAAETTAQGKAEAYQRITAKYPLEKEAYYWQGWCYQDIDQRKAVEAAEKALMLDPSYIQAVNMLGCLYLHQGIYDRGLELLKKYLALSPGDPNPLDSLGAAYLGAGDLDEAIRRFKEALDLDPNFGCEWKIAYIYALKEAYPEAIGWLDRGIANASSPAIRLDSYNMRAFYHNWVGDSDKALNDLDRVLEEAKANELTSLECQSLHWKAWILYDRGDVEAGEKCWKEYVKQAPSYSTTLVPLDHMVAINTCFYMGLCALKRGQVDKGSDYLLKMKTVLPDVPRRLARPFPGHAYCDILEGEIALALNRADKAVEICGKTAPWINLVDPFLSFYSSESEIHYYVVPFLKDTLARAFREAGRIDEAIAEYERLITFDPKRGEQPLIHPKYHYRLAQLYEEKGARAKAAREYRRFLDLWKDADPGIAEVEDARKRLAGLKGN